MNTEDLISAAGKIFAGVPAVIISENEILWKSSIFSDLAETIDADELIPAAKAALSSGKDTYTSFRSGKTVTVSMFTLSENTAAFTFRTEAVIPADISDSITAMTAQVRDSVQTVIMQTDSIYSELTCGVSGIRPEYLTKLASALNTIERSMIMAFSGVLIPDELLLYQNNGAIGRPVELSGFADSLCSDLNELGRKINVHCSCESGLWGFFREYTLELMITGLVQKAFLTDPHCKDISLFIRKKTLDGKDMISINAVTGDVPEKDIEDSLFGQIAYPQDFAPADLLGVLISCFCSRFGCKYSSISQNGLNALGILMPVCKKAENEITGNIRPTLANIRNERFSCTRIMLAGIGFSEKYGQ